MISALLVAVDSSAYARSAEEQAVALGKAYQARVSGLYVLDVRSVLHDLILGSTAEQLMRSMPFPVLLVP